MDFLFYVLLLSFGIGLGYLFKGVYFTKDKSDSFLTFLVYNLLLVTIITGLYTFLVETELNNQFANLFSIHLYVICILLPPAFYHYVKTLTNSLSLADSYHSGIKHYIPGVFLAIINIFAFVYLYVNDPLSDNFVHIKNVMEYSNFISFYFAFPIQAFVDLLKLRQFII